MGFKLRLAALGLWLMPLSGAWAMGSEFRVQDFEPEYIRQEEIQSQSCTSGLLHQVKQISQRLSLRLRSPGSHWTLPGMIWMQVLAVRVQGRWSPLSLLSKAEAERLRQAYSHENALCRYSIDTLATLSNPE